MGEGVWWCVPQHFSDLATVFFLSGTTCLLCCDVIENLLKGVIHLPAMCRASDSFISISVISWHVSVWESGKPDLIDANEKLLN